MQWTARPGSWWRRGQGARALAVLAGLGLAATGILLASTLTELQRSTNSAGDLATFRKLPEELVREADLALLTGDVSGLETIVNRGDLEVAQIVNEVSEDPLPETDGELRRVLEVWGLAIEQARTYAVTGGDNHELETAAHEVSHAVDELLLGLADRSASRLILLRRTMQGTLALALLIGVVFVVGMVRERGKLADVDPLTGLPNRERFRRATARALEAASKYSEATVAVIDVDRFRRVNESLGDAQGDRVLRDVARRMERALPEGAVLARRGSDEFLLLLPSMGYARGREVAGRILRALKQPFVYESGEVAVSVSVGIAVAPVHGREPEELIRAADRGRDIAKRDGGDAVRVTDSHKGEHEGELQLELEMRRALERDEFELFYQPQVDLESGAIVGAEALLRWRSGSRGLVLPGEFIPALEQSGLIVPVGDWVIRTATRQAAAWAREGRGPLRVAVNVSARQLYGGGLAETVEAALKETNLDPTLLEIEITESVAVQHPERSLAILAAIKELGVLVSLDDFGTGHSWLNRLKQLPGMALKIDRSFVDGLVRHPEDRAIVAGIVAVAHTLGLSVVAEGVEDEQQLALLQEMHCDVAQGFHFSPAVPVDEFSGFLEGAVPWLESVKAA